MKPKKNGLVTIIVLAIFFAILSMATGSLILLGIFILNIFLIYQGVFIMQNNPPHIGLITKWDKRVWRKDGNICVAEEGWGWLFLRGIMYKIIPINISKREIELPRPGEEDIILNTPDQVTLKCRIAIAYKPNKTEVINLLNLGTDDPFKVFENMLESISLDELRKWARHEDTPPHDYKALQNSGNEAVKVLIEAISNGRTLTENDLRKIRSGNGDWVMPQFGITLIRINIEKLDPFGEVYESALKIEKEMKERTAETFEVETDFKKAEKLKESFAKQGITKDINECLELVMRWKITREANSSLSVGAIAKIISESLRR